MLKNIVEKLNLDLVLRDADEFCYSEISKSKFKNLKYAQNYEELLLLHKENTEVEELIRKYPGEFRLRIYDYYNSLSKAKIDSVLTEKEIHYIKYNIETFSLFIRKFNYIKSSEQNNFVELSKYSDNISDFSELYSYLTSIIDEDGYIKPDASVELKNIKNNISKLRTKSDQILKQIIRNNTKKLSEAIVTKRNDRDVILVKPEYKNDFGGIIHDESASGNTFYIEPRENVIINNEISILKRKEKEEIYRILKEATFKVASYSEELKISLENFSSIEFIFSKINFSLNKGFTKPKIKLETDVELLDMYNPLIDVDKVVKNNVTLNNIDSSLIITGPNTGGKTVVLKTVGLCVSMAHLGLYIPAKFGSTIGYFEKIFIDIGDSQSIEHNLSTFSSHMTNIIFILKNVNSKSLVLLDELCSGTDPSEGAALSMALLNELKQKGATVLCTTHYPEIKDYCFKSNYYKNSSLEFDFENLRPTYKFIIGLPGKSNAINISSKLGLFDNIIEEANSYITETEKENSILIDELSENIREYEQKLQYINHAILETENLKNTLQKNLSEYYKYKDSLYNELYNSFNQDIENKKEELLVWYKSIKDSSTMKQHEFNDMLHEIENLRTQTAEHTPKFRKQDNRVLKVGDDVLVISYNQRATVIDIKNDNITIKLGALKMAVKRNEIEYLEKEKEVRDRIYTTQKATNNNISLSINVIGKNTEEAIIEIENYMDKVLLTGYETFTIIHGMGAGILKKNISEYLSNNRYVASYRSGGEKEGGLGVTIVEMK